MKNEASSQIIERVYLISKKVVQTQFPKEMEFFDSIWEVMKKYIYQWKEKMPKEWHTYEYQERLKEELGFLDEAEISEINTPKVIALISLVWLRLAKFKGEVQDVNIEETIAEYGKSLPEWLRLKTIRLAVPMIKDDLKKIGRIPVIEEGEEKKYMMYSHDNKKGEPLTESQYNEQKENDKSKFLIWLDEKNRDLFINGDKPDIVYPEERRALACLIKNIGNIAYYKNLYEAIHNMRWLDDDVWNNRRVEYMNDVYKCISSLCGHCPQIDRFISTKKGDGYKLELPDGVRFCLLTELPEKIA